MLDKHHAWYIGIFVHKKFDLKSQAQGQGNTLNWFTGTFDLDLKFRSKVKDQTTYDKERYLGSPLLILTIQIQ